MDDDNDSIAIDVNDMRDVEEVEPTTTATESSTEETKDTDQVEGFDEPESIPETEGDKEEGEKSDDTETAEETKEEDQPKTKADERKEQLNTEIRDLVAQRNSIRQEVETLNAQAYRPATEQELLEQVNPETGEYYNPLEAKITAMEQRQQISEYNNQVAESRLALTSEAMRAVSDFPMFDEQSAEFKPEIAAKVDSIIEPNLIRDPNVPEIDPATGQPTGRGIVIGSKIPLYPLYQTIAEASRASATEGQVKAQRATEQMLAHSDTPTSSPVKETPKDSFEAGFDSVM